MIGLGLIWFAVRLSAEPADDDHRYGHSKAEPLSALSRAAFVFGAAGLVAVEAGRAVLDPTPLQAPEIAIGVALFTIVAMGVLVAYQRRVARRPVRSPSSPTVSNTAPTFWLAAACWRRCSGR